MKNEAKKHYPEIEEADWEEHGVEPWDLDDPEDGGYRECPACHGEATRWDIFVRCDTCGGSGDVQWSNSEDE